MTPEQQATVKRLRRAHGEHRGYEGMVPDYIVVADLYLAEHPSDAPSAADELREARRIIKAFEDDVAVEAYDTPIRKRSRAFLTRTAWIEQQETT